MVHEPDLTPQRSHRDRKNSLQVVVCGSMNGTPSLIERLLHQSRALCEDQSGLQGADPRAFVARPAKLDFGLLMDDVGEGHQTLAPDVAYKSFSTNKRAFVLAEVKEHENCISTLIRCGSTADLALLLVDAGKGVGTQTRLYTHVLTLLGIKKVVLLVNEMDLVGFSRPTFVEIESQYRRFCDEIRLQIQAIPISTLSGDNIVELSAIMDWYKDSTLLQYLEEFELKQDLQVAPGDVVATAADPPPIADQFEATLIWIHPAPLLPGRKYKIKIGARTVLATVAPLKYRININSLEHVAAETLALNDIGVVEMELDQKIPFEPYSLNGILGGFVLCDRLTDKTVGVGFLHFALRRSDNVHWQALAVSKKVRAGIKKQGPCVIWFTGLSGAGKSTIANLVEKRLVSMNRHTYLLDGDNVRHGLNKDLGFTAQDRVENIRRVGEVAKLMVDAGLIVLAAFISPFRVERRMVRDLLEGREFIEVFVDTPMSVAEERDPKGLYKRARRGELKNFTGIDSPYEPPEKPEIRIDTTALTAEDAVLEIIQMMVARGILNPS